MFLVEFMIVLCFLYKKAMFFFTLYYKGILKSLQKICIKGLIGKVRESKRIKKGQKGGFWGVLGVKGVYTPKGPKKA